MECLEGHLGAGLADTLPSEGADSCAGLGDLFEVLFVAALEELGQLDFCDGIDAVHALEHAGVVQRGGGRVAGGVQAVTLPQPAQRVDEAAGARPVLACVAEELVDIPHKPPGQLGYLLQPQERLDLPGHLVRQ